jgi:hypothetical protein
VLIRRRRIHILIEESHQGGTHLRRERVLVETQHTYGVPQSGVPVRLRSFCLRILRLFRSPRLPVESASESPKLLLVHSSTKTSQGDPR